MDKTKFLTASEIAIHLLAFLLTNKDKNREIEFGALGKNFSELCLEIIKVLTPRAKQHTNSALGRCA